MLKTEKTEVLGWDHAIRGMRNPKNSWDKTDTDEFLYAYAEYDIPQPDIGPNDYNLMKTLRNAGTDHRKFMRMIVVYADITAPLYWWKEYDTYKVGTVANSCSTMHKIHAKEFTLDDFSHEHLTPLALDALGNVIGTLNRYRERFIAWDHLDDNSKNAYFLYEQKDAWWQLIQLLPTSYNQKRTVMVNYEVLANIYKSRKNHKLDEWHTFCDWIRSLPYSELITGEFEEETQTRVDECKTCGFEDSCPSAHFHPIEPHSHCADYRSISNKEETQK